MKGLLHEAYEGLASQLLLWRGDAFRCFLRIDGNVQIGKLGKIEDTYRLERVLPTFHMLKELGASVTCATHIHAYDAAGRFVGVAPIARWFAQQGYGTADRYAWLENLYSDSSEKNLDESWAAAMQLLHDRYVLDSFGALHTVGASLTLLPHYFRPENRTVGLLVESELNMLALLTCPVRRPVVGLLGGGQAAKVAYCHSLLRNGVDEVWLTPALSETYTKMALHENFCDGIVRIPVDYYDHSMRSSAWCERPITIGQNTLKEWSSRMKGVRTLIVNGISGEDSVRGSYEPILNLLRVAIDNGVTIIAGGGTTAALIRTYKLCAHVAHLSTGGGSLLFLLSGERSPSLDATISSL